MPIGHDDPFIDYYHVLGVPPAASGEEVKQAYRQAAKKAHPDAGGSSAAMDSLNQAYAVLGDPAKRAIFDQERQLHDAPPPVQPSASAAASSPVQSDAQLHAARQELRRLRVAYARHSGLEIIRWSLVAGAGLGALMWLFGGLITGGVVRAILLVGLGGSGFGLVFGITCLTDPDHRLVLFDLSWRHRQFPDRQWWLITAAQFVTGVLLGAGLGWWLLSQAPSSLFGA
jgi:hypothetical protein